MTNTRGSRLSAAAFLFLLALPLRADAQAIAASPPGLQESLVIDEIRVTLLAVEGLARPDLRTTNGAAAGGLRLVWFVENRPGVPVPPVLGAVRVFFGSQLYNPITNAASRRPLAPDITVHDPARFFASRRGRAIPDRPPLPRPDAVTSVLEVVVRGGEIAARADGMAEIELSSTDGTRLEAGRVQLPKGRPVDYHWFTFGLPPLPAPCPADRRCL